MFTPIEFKSSGALCRGRLYPPKAGEANGAGIVIAHGLCGTMDSGLFAYAEAFAAAGFHALVFDYRGFGESDGTPRQFVSVPHQIKDWQQAIGFLRRHDNVDASRIGLWGVSFSGGHVVHLAHDDTKIRAVVAQVPMLDPVLALNVGNFQRGVEKTLALQAAVMTYFKNRWGSQQADMLLVAPDGSENPAMLAADEAAAYAKIAGPSWRNELHPKSLISGKVERNNASLLTDDVTSPILIQMGEDDKIVSNEASHNFSRRCGPLATLSVYKKAGHFTLLRKNAKRTAAITEAISFYKQHLIL